MKGVNDFNAGRKDTIVRSNVAVELGWVAASSERREWLFVQDAHGDQGMSAEGVELYKKLNNLGAPPPPLPLPAVRALIKRSSGRRA